MNDKWMAKDSERWNDPSQIRVARRFRHHVRTTSNPRGRIHREPCFNIRECGSTKPADAHHVDYNQPFLVLWVCVNCHRKVDHNSLKFKKSDLWDYSSVVRVRGKTWAENRPVRDDVPF